MALMKQLFGLCLLLLLVGGNADNADYSDIEYEDGGDIADIEYEVIADAEVINLELELLPTPSIGPCASNPCPSDSTCQELSTGHTCVCRPGLFYNEAMNSCYLAKTFPTDIRLKEEYVPEMSDKNSAIFKNTANKILIELKAAFKNPNYLGSTVLSLRQGSVIADVENFFSPSSDVTEDIVKKELDTAIAGATGILKAAEITYNTVCTKGFCDDESTSCDPINGLATCTCRKGYIKITATQQACVPCPSGEKAVSSEKCAACSFGYSGFNCEDSYLLILVVVGCILGTLLLATLTGAIVLYTRSKKTTKSSDKPFTNGNLEYTKPAGIPRIPRVNPNSGWQPNNLEMTNSGSRNALVIKDRSENTMWSYDYPEDTRSYKSQTTSRTGYGPSVSNNVPRATRNPYFDAYDDNVRRY